MFYSLVHVNNSRDTEKMDVREISEQVSHALETAVSIRLEAFQGQSDGFKSTLKGRHSISHSGPWIASIESHDQHCLGCGIDFETQNSISDSALGLFLTDREISWCAKRRFKFDLIELWTIKEAVFKADPDNQNSVLSDYEIVAPDESSARKLTAGGADFRFHCLRFESGVLSAAVVKI